MDINLGHYDLSRAYERAQKRMLRQVDESFLFIFDPSEVVKPFGKKMEGLTFVLDASEKPRLVSDPKTGKLTRQPQTMTQVIIKSVATSAARSAGTQIARAILRGVLGNMLKR